MRSILWILFVPAFISIGHSQVLVVAETILQIKGSEAQALFFRFAAGDEIQFSFSETGGKKLKLVEVLEWPNEVVYQARDVIGSKVQYLRVSATGVYSFRFVSDSGVRAVQITLKRKPQSESLFKFDTSVRFQTRQDTFYRKGAEEWPGFEYRSERLSRNILVHADTSALTLLEKTERIAARTGIIYGGNTAEMRFSLPKNQYLPSEEQVQASNEMISWAFWIGVGDEADRNYRDANLKAVARLADLASGLQLISVSGGYGALALLALKGVALFSNPPKGNNVRYTLWNDRGKSLDSGSSIVAFRRMEAPLQGDFLFQLSNDNVIEGINVHVKVLAVIQQKKFLREDYLVYHRMAVAPQHRDGKVIIREVRAPAFGEP